MINAKVFVPQCPARFDTAINSWVPTVDLRPAQVYGEVKVALPPEASRLPIEQTMAMLESALHAFDEERDSLVALGDPTFIAASAFLLARNGATRLRMLRWDRRRGAYDAVELGAA